MNIYERSLLYLSGMLMKEKIYIKIIVSLKLFIKFFFNKF